METLTETEYRLMVVIWEKQNLTSMELVNICITKFAWKKSTTYTMLKKLEKKGMIKNDSTVLQILVSKKEYENQEKRKVIKKYFKNSLPDFFVAFAHEKKLSKEDIDELEHIIAEYKENLDD